MESCRLPCSHSQHNGTGGELSRSPRTRAIHQNESLFTPSRYCDRAHVFVGVVGALLCYLDRVIQDAGYGLQRIPLPRTRVNRASLPMRQGSLCGMLRGVSSNRHMPREGEGAVVRQGCTIALVVSFLMGCAVVLVAGASG